VIAGHQRLHLFGRVFGVNARRLRLPLTLEAGELALSALEQLVERRLDHLLGGELGAKARGTERECAAGVRHDVDAQEGLEIFECVNDAVVAGAKAGQERRVLHRGESARHVAAKEVDDPRQLVERDVDEHARNLAQVALALGEQPANALFARDHRSEPRRRRREVPFDEQVDARRGGAAVEVGLMAPILNLVQAEPLPSRWCRTSSRSMARGVSSRAASRARKASRQRTTHASSLAKPAADQSSSSPSLACRPSAVALVGCWAGNSARKVSTSPSKRATSAGEAPGAAAASVERNVIVPMIQRVDI